MASRPVDIGDWSGKQAPGPLGPALHRFHSPWLMSALTYDSGEGPEVRYWGRTLIELQKKKWNKPGTQT